MSRRNPFALTSPCGNCPFRATRPIYLRPGRIREIRAGIESDGIFHCHKTVVHDDDGDEYRAAGGDEKACAGSLILQKKLGTLTANLLNRLAMGLGFLDPDRLDENAPIFDSWEDMEKAMEEV